MYLLSYSDCNFSLEYNGDDILLLAMNGTGIVDSIQCDNYPDCLQKVCLLGKEPDKQGVFLWTNDDPIDCR